MIPQPAERVGVFGGSFDPPHTSHLLLAAYVLSSAPVDRLMIVPTWQHALDKEATASFEHRVRMCELAFADLLRVSVSTIEHELAGRSYTLRTLEALGAQLPRAAFRLVLGADILEETHRWHRFADVRELAPLIVVGRVGFPVPEGSDPTILLPAVSSTDVRQRLARGESVDGLVPARVMEYVDAERLYRLPESSA